jgi:hypothetical protein
MRKEKKKLSMQKLLTKETYVIRGEVRVTRVAATFDCYLHNGAIIHKEGRRGGEGEGMPPSTHLERISSRLRLGKIRATREVSKDPLPPSIE